MKTFERKGTAKEPDKRHARTSVKVWTNKRPKDKVWIQAAKVIETAAMMKGGCSGCKGCNAAKEQKRAAAKRCMRTKNEHAHK